MTEQIALLTYKSRVFEKVMDLTNYKYIGNEKVWDYIEKLDRRDLDYLYALIKGKESEIINQKISEAIK